MQTPKGVACLCTGVTFEQIAHHRQSVPGTTEESLVDALGCGRQCGSCRPHLASALGETAWYAAHAVVTPLSQAANADALDYLIYEVALTIQAPNYPASRPGQHVVLRVPVGQGLVERTYTVVEQSLDGGQLKLAVRRHPGGALTPFLLRDEPASSFAVEVSAPGGPGLTVDTDRPVVFFAGGVGITPAVSLLESLPDSAMAYLDYSASTSQDMVYAERFEQLKSRVPGFVTKFRHTQTEGCLNSEAVAGIAGHWSQAQFFLCGPNIFVDEARSALLRAGVTPEAIHVELFSLRAEPGPAMSFRSKLYAASGALALALLAVLFFFSSLEDQRPHGHPNVGHADLKCMACHTDAPGSTRQILQAKVKHLIGLRETDADFGKLPVTNAVCVQCHANPDDRHPANRFLEPRFEKAREAVGAHMCVSCHREHSNARVTVPTTTFCVQCHQEMKVKNDPAQPTHEELVRTKSWQSCVQCHDFHGNHSRMTPLRLSDATDLLSVSNYLSRGASPYGETIVKAKEPVQP